MSESLSEFGFALQDFLLEQSVVGGFGRLGYQLRKAHWQPLPEDLSQRVMIVTGANSGLGYATAEALARRGAQLILACRSAERGQAALARLQAETGNQQLQLELLDVGHQASVRAFAERVAAAHPRIHALIHNAGALTHQRQESPEGIELTLATHVLGPHLLTALLRPQLAAAGSTAEPARVIFVSSGGMYLARLNPEDLQFQQRAYHGTQAYAEAKRGMLYLAQLWAAAFVREALPIAAYAMHPGWADTPGVQAALPGFRRLSRLLLRNNAEGADTTVWLAATDQVLQNGGFYADRALRPRYRMASTRSSPSEIERWWQRLGELTEMPLPFPLALPERRTED